MLEKTLLSIAVSGVMLPFAANAFDLSSEEIQPGKHIQEKNVFNGFGCKGDNVSPALSWRNPPKGTKSFALMVHDPDAPTGGAGFWHWAVVDLPASATSLPAGAGTVDGKRLPAGARQFSNDYSMTGWGGPCPPVGDKPHRYNFTVYALKVDKLEVPEKASTSVVGFLVNANALGKATLTGLYGR